MPPSSLGEAGVLGHTEGQLGEVFLDDARVGGPGVQVYGMGVDIVLDEVALETTSAW